MEDRVLPPEASLDLQIHLDNVSKLQERCRDGLRRLVDGRLSRTDYLSLLNRHSAAQRAWEERHGKYFREG